MAEEKKIIPRLGKAAGEFNVGLSSIVALLKKKYSIDIVENINTKLTPEIYEILLKEFLGEKLVKEESMKVEIGVFAKSKSDIEEHKASTKIQPEVTPQPVAPEPKKAETPANEIIPIEITKVDVQKPKFVGKIELEETKVEVQTTEVIISEEQAPELIETPIVILDTEVKIEKEKEKEPKEPSSPELPATVIEEHTSKINVIGKIDLTEFERKRPSSDKRKQQVKPAEKQLKKEKEQKSKVIIEPQPKDQPIIKEEVTKIEEPIVPNVPIIEHIETKHRTISGPKVLGTIDLGALTTKPSPKKETPAEPPSKPKKQRKRIRVKQSANKPTTPGVSQKLVVITKAEISEEDIQKQIRETMQRLEPLGKSKTSKRKREKRAHVQSEMREQGLQDLQNQKIVKVTEFSTANDLAVLMDVPVTKIIATCMSIGLFVSINQRLDAETISLLTDEFGYEVEFIGVDTEETVKSEEEDRPEDLKPRHPIITVMGHVDHGKTSLLDYIRKTNVIVGEAGGITQHIGAYLFNLPDGRKITFLDTPGHEAFTAMRARGAKVTDLCIIVIAADDSVMPQTVEAINHAQAAGVPMVFAITKIDKANAAPEKIREALANMNILVEDWGGSYQCQEINSKLGTGIDILMEKILIEAEMLELKANPSRLGSGTVLESSLDKGKGYVAKVLIQNGKVKIGDPVLAGNYYGKVKALYNERGQQVTETGPATPILLLGLNGAPQAGDLLKVAANEHDARIAATKRAQLAREMGLRTQKHITLDEIGRRIAIGDFKELNIIVKGDVDGSVEALSDSLLKLSTQQVQVNVIHKSVGAVTESDVLLASASNAIIVAFQVRPSPGSRKLAEQEQIDIRTYSIIYTAINEIKDAIEGMHTPEVREKILCNLQVREVFKITKVGNIAGCIALDGKLQRATKIRLIRDGIVIYTGKLGTLKRFKDEVKEVVAGQDCGLNIDNFNDIKVGDIVEGYEEYEVKVVL